MQNISKNQNFFLDEIENLNEPKVDCVDFVLVYWKNSDKKEIIDNYCHNLSVNGLVLQHEENVEEELEFVLVSIPFEKCLEIAEKIKLKLPIESAMEDKHQARYFEEHRDKFTVPYNSKIRYKFEKFFNKEKLENSISERDRILLVHEILSRTEYSERHNEPSIFSIKENDSNFGIERLLAKGAFIDAYPLHKDHVKIKAKISKKQFLYEYFIKSNKSSNLLPIFVIRDYFGEKVAFYFAWLNFYTSWLIFPSIVGFIVCLYGLMTYSADLPTKARKNFFDNFFKTEFFTGIQCEN
ncbi:anoctamin-7 [Brachionus plicatilis]|uniref:Anoctamin n=1 Tax=Brachionus plicatilis TaxID=10195 RepID=A0A3M7PR58_BRAPC|nr:anoctamin-7 [Brachionus plicatilis]